MGQAFCKQLMDRAAASCAALVLTWVGSMGLAQAEATTGEAPPAAEGLTIAPPSSDAQPQKVDDAKKTAKAAALTPIVPSPRNPLRPAFQLYAEIDLPILAVGLVFAEARLVRSQQAYCAPLCDRNSLNAIDRVTAGYWSPGWQTASDWGLYAVGVGAAALIFADEGFFAGLNDSVVVAESTLGATAIASIMTLAAGRPRPFLYGEKAPLSNRNSADAGLSFLSNHAAESFAIATSMVVTMRRLHPGSKLTWIVAGVGGAMATFVATARVLGGMHFITDVVGGAVVGSSVGVIVPSLHASPVSIIPVAADGQHGLALVARF